MQRAKRQRELGCGFTLFGWDGDTLAWESSPPRDDGDTGRTVHYLYEPGSFVPVAQALRKRPIVLHRQPDWRQREYDFDQDPLWQTTMPPQAFDAIAWYHCDHLGTPMELTDPHGNVAWAGQYKAWGEVREERSEWAKQHGLGNPIRFQGQYHDHETGLHYNRHRYYDTRGARFICKDPISYAGGLNQYVYAPNPTSWIDQLGLAKESCCGPKATDVVDQTAGSIKNVNPGYPEAGRTHNCVNCSIATDATLAGNPASALPINHTKGVPLSILEKQFSSKFGPVIAPENIAQQMASSGNGARGIVFGSYGPGQPGHVFNVINQNGVVRFLDGQTGKPANLSNFKTLQLLRTN